MEMFTNFYERNQSKIDEAGVEIATNLLSSFIKKGDSKPSTVIKPSPQIVQVEKKDYTWYFVGGAVAVLALTAFVVLRK